MSFTLRENITAVIETCFSETKDEIQEVAINKILELIRNDKADRKTEPQPDLAQALAEGKESILSLATKGKMAKRTERSSE